MSTSDDKPHIPGDHLLGIKAEDRAGEDIEQKSPGERAEPVDNRTRRRQLIGLAVGILASVLIYFIMPGDVPHMAKLTAATAVLMAVWWMTEAIPIPATALLPLIVFPVLGDAKFDTIGASYGNNVIFLFMGGFLLALAMQRWNLHRRIALVTVRAMGTNSSMVVAGFMIATGFISMWVSNTATAVMMIPIGVSVLMLVGKLGAEHGGEELGVLADSAADAESDEVKQAVIKSDFGTALMLGIAYAASVGSLGTLIGTPPNTLLAGYMADNHDMQIGFGQWMIVGVPLSVVMLFAVWVLLTKILYKPEVKKIPGGRELMSAELDKLGSISKGETRVLIIFVLAAVAWITVPLLFDSVVSDAGIAMIAGLLLFLLPGGAGKGVRLLDWESALKLPWGVLLLFGGGLALSSQFSSSGLTEWMGDAVAGLGAIPTIAMVIIFTTAIVFLTELTSNTATAATFLPVAGGVALGLGMHPLLLAGPVALAATCAFMLPVATPPNAIAYGSGYVTIGQMIKGGFWLNIIGIVLITATTMTLMVMVFGLTT